MLFIVGCRYPTFLTMRCAVACTTLHCIIRHPFSLTCHIIPHRTAPQSINYDIVRASRAAVDATNEGGLNPVLHLIILTAVCRPRGPGSHCFRKFWGWGGASNDLKSRDRSLTAGNGCGRAAWCGAGRRRGFCRKREHPALSSQSNYSYRGPVALCCISFVVYRHRGIEGCLIQVVNHTGVYLGMDIISRLSDVCMCHMT